MEFLRVPLTDESGDEVKKRFFNFLQTFRDDTGIPDGLDADDENYHLG